MEGRRRSVPELLNESSLSQMMTPFHFEQMNVIFQIHTAHIAARTRIRRFHVPTIHCDVDFHGEWPLRGAHEASLLNLILHIHDTFACDFALYLVTLLNLFI